MVVSTKEEFKKAIENKTDEFVVVGELAKDLEKTSVLKKLSGPALAAIALTLISFPATGGLSVVHAFRAAPAVLALSTESGVSIGILFIMVSIGVSVLISSFNDYDTEVKMDAGKSGISIKYKRRAKKTE